MRMSGNLHLRHLRRLPPLPRSLRLRAPSPSSLPTVALDNAHFTLKHIEHGRPISPPPPLRCWSWCVHLRLCPSPPSSLCSAARTGSVLAHYELSSWLLSEDIAASSLPPCYPSPSHSALTLHSPAALTPSSLRGAIQLTPGVLSGLYIWQEPLKEYTEEQKNRGKPLVPPSDVSPQAGEVAKAAVTAPRKDAPEATAAAAAAAAGVADVPSK